MSCTLDELFIACSFLCYDRPAASKRVAMRSRAFYLRQVDLLYLQMLMSVWQPAPGMHRY